MPNAFDITSLTVVAQADAAIRISDTFDPQEHGPNEQYTIPFIYYRGVGPIAGGFDVDWYETEEHRSAAADTPGAGTVISNHAPTGSPTNANGGASPLEGLPLPAIGGVTAGVATGYLSGRTPSRAPDGSALSGKKTYFCRIWILQS